MIRGSRALRTSVHSGLATTLVFASLIGCSSDNGDSTPSGVEGLYRFICQAGDECSPRVEDGLEPSGIYLRDGKVLEASVLAGGDVCLFEQEGTYTVVAGGIRFSYPGDEESPARSEVAKLEDGVLENGDEPLKQIGQVTIADPGRCLD